MKYAIIGFFLITALGAQRISAQDEERPRFRERLVDVKKKKLLETLDLPDAKKEAFLKQYEIYSDDRRKLNKERKTILKKLVHMSALDGEISGEVIRKTIDDLSAVEKKIIDQRQKAIEQFSGTLDDGQLAKFILFEQTFPFKLREMMFEMQARKFRDKKDKFFIPPPEDDILD